MEINVADNVQLVQPENTTCASDSSVEENVTLNNVNKADFSNHQSINDENDKKENSAVDVKHLDSNLISPNSSENVVKKTSPSLPKNSKSVRHKSSDKLAQVIETCKKLQKLSKQKSPNKTQENEKSVNISPSVSDTCGLNDTTSETLAAAPISGVSVDLPKQTQVDHCLLANNVEKVSTRKADILVPAVNDSSSASSSQFAPDTSGDLVLKRFLFLFRPSDHEVLVRNKGINMYRCNVCGGMYRQKFSLKRHFLRTHINFRYISKADISNCKIAVPDHYTQQDSNSDCSETTNGRKKFNSSNAIFLENNKASVMPGLYICHMCVGMTFDHEQELRNHYNTHSDFERKKFQCDKCSASFFKKQILSRHLASHGEKVHRKTCKKCGAECTSKGEYHRHILSHSNGRVCKYCSKILSTSANRKRHEALHLGLKPYSCVHCGMSFSQSKDLDRHLRKQHTNLCYCCDACSKLFPSQASLDVHMHEKHTGTTPKKERPSSPESIENAIINKSTSGNVAPIKLKICYVCKRSFPTFYAMMKHRQQAHPYHKKRKKHRKSMKQKLAQANHGENDLNQGIKPRRPYVRRAKPNGNIPNPTVRRGRPPIDRAVKFGRQSDRAGQRFLTKREKELAKREEMEYYCSLSEKIAENLLHFVDGKTSQLSLKEYNYSDQPYPPYHFEDRGRLPWSNYNFPNEYDVDYALKTRGQEVKNILPENLSSRDKCLFATGLNRILVPPQVIENVVSEKHVEPCNSVSETVSIPVAGIHHRKLNLEERKKLIGREVATICLCYVCKENFESSAAFKEHCVNNHPNVHCSCIEIEGSKDSPPVIPEDFCKQDVSPNGIFFSWNVPPPLSESSLLKCTKCKSDFKTSLELHSHIIVCGNLKSSPTHVWRFNIQKRIKRTMKNRMSLAQQQAAVNRYSKDFKTPVKHQFNSNNRGVKSSEKVLKSVEKAQFYKSGRLQTTSLAVGMNYFNTKPMKPPVNTISKRGRKSYATLSYRYRYASVQPSSALECSDCKQTFPSQSTLNLHMQSHFIQPRSSEENVKTVPATDSSSNKVIVNVPCVQNTSTAASIISSPNVSEFVFDGDRHESTSRFKFSQPISAHTNTLPLLSKISENNSKVLKMDSQCTSNLKKGNGVLDLRNSDLVTTPIDLSRNLNDINSVTLDLSNKKKDATVSKKSALELAMKAVKEFSQSSEQNEFISKLQKTVEKISPPNAVTSPLLSKPAIVKRVGRPKKVKRLGPFHFRKHLPPSPVEISREVSSKPVSKLEETVKRLTENKVKSHISLSEENTPPFKTTSGVKENIKCEKKLDAVSMKSIVPPTKSSVDKVIGKEIKVPQIPVSKTAISTDGNFVPIIIYDDQNKSSSVHNSFNNDQSIDKSSSQNAIEDTLNATSLEETTDKIPAKLVDFDNNLTPEKTFKPSRELDLPGTSSSESPGKKSERSSGSQGRISPSLESIVNSIKQKLHSQEQESSPHDDVPLSWLEDEKFEIPPSRPKLRLPGSANSDSSLSVDNEHFLPISADTNDFRDLASLELQQSVKCSFENATKLVSFSAAVGDEKENSFASNLPHETKSAVCLDSNSSEIKSSPSAIASAVEKLEISQISERESAESMLSNEMALTKSAEHAISGVEKQQQDSQTPIIKDEKHKRKKVVASTPTGNIKYAQKEFNSLNKNPIHKKPGRPRKKTVEPSISTTVDITTSTETENLNLSKAGLIKELYIPNSINSASTENIDLAQKEVKLSSHPVEQEGDLNSTTNIQKVDLSILSPSIEEQTNVRDLENNDSQERLSSTTHPDIASCQLESNSAACKPSSLRAFRSKIKPTDSTGSETDSSIGTKLTTEFGKNLASRMKEKMRLSFENASLENVPRSDEVNSDGVPDSSISDINAQVSDDDSEYFRVIKKEIESSEPTKKHGCPFCRLEFAYLTNFRRHLRICKARYESKEVEPVPSTSASVLQYLPKKDEVEHSMLNLLRHQSRQTQMLKEAEKSTGSKVESKFRTYSCNVCHRIYLSLFKLLQHQVTHKLIPSNSSETSTVSPNLENTKDINDIEKYSVVNELEENTIHYSEFSKDKDLNVDMKLMTDDQESIETQSEHNGETQLITNPNAVESVAETTDYSQSDDNVVKLVQSTTEIENRQSDELIKNSNPKEVTVKNEEQPVKRKRGRPFGWRKIAILPENMTSKTLRRNFKTSQAALFSVKKKADKIHQSPIKRRRKKLFFTKMKTKTGKPVANKQVISPECFEFSAEEDLPLSLMSTNETVGIKLEEDNLILQDSSVIHTNKSKIAPKRSYVKKMTIAGKPSSQKEVKNSGPIKRKRKKIFTRMKIKTGRSVMSKISSAKRFKFIPDEDLPLSLISTDEAIEIKCEEGSLVLPDSSIIMKEKSKVSTKRSYVRKIPATGKAAFLKGAKDPSPIKRRRKKFFFTKLKMKTGRPITSKLKKNVSPECSEFIADEDLPLNLISTYETTEIKTEDSLVLQNPPVIKKEKTKISPKRSFVKTMNKGNASSPKSVKDVFEIEITKIPQKLVVKTTSKLTPPIVQKNNLDQVLKRRGRPPISIKTDQPVVKQEFPLKRRPGRPPKNLQCIPSTSQSKGFYSQPGCSRSFRKILPRSIPLDSSDSEYDIAVKQDTIPKKKVVHFKSCPICKEKFSASLILLRHVQLVHSRRAEDAIKTETQSSPKLNKKSISRSPVGNSSPEAVKILKKMSPKSVVDKSLDGGEKVFKKMSPKLIVDKSLDGGEKVFKKMSPKLVVNKSLDGSETVFKKMSPKLVAAKSPDGGKVLKKSIAKSIDVDYSDTDSANDFKEMFRKSLPVSKAAGVKVFKRQRSKTTNIVNSNNGITKYFKKMPKTVKDIYSDSNFAKICTRITTESVIDCNTDVDNGRNIKKQNPRSAIDDISDANISKSLKKIRAKSILDSNSDASSVKSFKRITAKGIADDNSDSSSVKSNKKISTKPNNDNTVIDSIKSFKKVSAKSIMENNCDSRSIKSTKRTSAKYIAADYIETSSVKRKITSKSITNESSDAESTKGSKKVIAKSFSDDNSDADSTKGMKKVFSKLITAYNSNSESPKLLKRSISQSVSLENSDADSDFSVKTDITPLKLFKKCPICKEKFTAGSILHRHIQMMHSRRTNLPSDNIIEFPEASTPTQLDNLPPMKFKMDNPAESPEIFTSPNQLSPSMEMKMMDAASRGALSRQCRKPLPPLKRKWSKKDLSQDQTNTSKSS